MKNFYCFTIQSGIPLEEAWQELEDAGIELAYGSEEDDLKQLYGYGENEKKFNSLQSVSFFELTQLPPIDWEAQWKEHGWDFYDGVVHVNLSQFGSKEKILTLKPGPGFGDLSHPTTRLVLTLMSSEIQKQTVIDIGCGSGILALAAIAMGASRAYGIDIDPQAIEHSQLNAELNEMEKDCDFCLPQTFNLAMHEDEPLILMNMIASEQEIAWKSLPALHPLSCHLITSGIRVEDKDIYLKQAAQRGWQLVKEKQEEEWCAFVFVQLK